MKKYLIGDTDSDKVEMTIDELKEKILSYKDPEPDEKLPARDNCCICLRNGSGRVCSPECNFIYNQIFNTKNNPEKSIFDELRRDLWIARGWQIPTTKWSDIKWESQ